MSQAPNIDGVLITWGDRLFYPGNRVVKLKPQPKPNGDSARQRAAAIRARIEALRAIADQWRFGGTRILEVTGVNYLGCRVGSGEEFVVVVGQRAVRAAGASA